MSAFSLAWRTARRYKARALLAVAGVAIIGALNFDMLLLARGLLLSFADMIGAAAYDVRVVGGAGLPIARLPVTDAARVAADLRRLPEVRAVALVRGGSAVVLPPEGASAGATLVATDDPVGAGVWTLVAGTGPPGEPAGPKSVTNPPAVISRSLAAAFGLGPGSIVRVRVQLADARSALPAIEFRVAGVADFRFEPAADYVLQTTLDGFARAQGGAEADEADMVLVASASWAGADRAAAAAMRVRPELRAFSNEQVVANFNRNAFAYFRQVSAVLSTTTIVFAFLLVATLLTVSVNQRLGEVAALRALGISRRRIAATLLWESAMLVGVGGVVAVPLGLALAQALDRILRRMPRLPSGLHFFVFEPRALGIHAGVLAFTAIVAAVYPVWLAVKLPIAETLRQEVVS